MRQVRAIFHEHPMSGDRPYGHVRCPAIGLARTVAGLHANAMHAHTNGGVACVH